MHRHESVQTLVAGIDGNLASVQARMARHGGTPCQACALRPLALLAAAARCGMPYVPLHLGGSPKKLPQPPGSSFLPWAVPACLFSPSAHPPPHPGHHYSAMAAGSAGGAHLNSYALYQCRTLLLGVPYWNVVERYNSQGGWKCYKGRSVPGAEVLSLLEQGLLDKMVPVLGIQQPLNPRMWLPSSLFLPLDTLRNSCFTPTPGLKTTYFRYVPLSAKQLEDMNRDNRLLFNQPGH
ncbi:hypothetical protein DUNSADRAFT_12272 [Dunaliella salina]|uniref:Uncharacterized protein n=1 Tax=Dunaliella salina TaxID=3046 RepID=A0ABQ7H3Y9_DUNSA|nr:hypothetical protein DUNSADRAFT_12272 [Dunaliella salina]|eukprot:KAF5841574.1 hypothetical protein DUNSADRAFT_12272 [Dunaliella salina]